MAKKKATKKAVAKQDKNLPVAINEAEFGAGFEDADMSAYALPFITVLQKLSPQVDEDDAAYIKGAKPGMFFNTVTEETFKELTIVPVKYQRCFIEWIPRGQGGGFVANHGPSETILESCTLHEEKKFLHMTEDGHEMKDHRNHYVVIETKNGFEQAIISLTSSQIKKSRKWMSQMQGLKVKVGNAKKTPPMYFSCYKATLVKEENDQGKWFGWSLVREGFANEAQVEAGRDFKTAIDKGLAQADFSKMQEATEDDTEY